MFYFFNFFYHVGIKKKKFNCLIYYSPPPTKIFWLRHLFYVWISHIRLMFISYEISVYTLSTK